MGWRFASAAFRLHRPLILAAPQSFGNLAASAIAGALWTLVSPTAAFLFLVPAMLVSLAGLTLARDPSAV